MKKCMAKLLLVLMTLAVAIPESEARRMGGGRSSGRQSSAITRQARPPAAPPFQRADPAPARPPSAPAQRPDQGLARGPAPAPMSPPARQGSAWGGMLGGALLGLGLGSLMSHGNDRNTETASGTSGTNGENQAGTDNTAVAREPAQSDGTGKWWLFGLLALAVVFFLRRARRKKPQYPRF